MVVRLETVGAHPAPSKGHPRHDVRFYDGERFPAEDGASFLAEALNDGGGAMVLARADHGAAIERALTERGVDVPSARARGRLVVLDGVAAAAEIEDGVEPARMLEERVASKLEALCATGRVRVLGEAVDVLAKRGLTEAAVRLEAAWNALQARAPFELLCIYSFASFESASAGHSFAQVCDQHGAVRLAAAGPLELDRNRLTAQLEQRRVALAAEVERRERLEVERSAHSAGERLLARAADELASSLHFDETIDRVAHLAVPTLADWCLVDLVVPEEGVFERVAVGHHRPDGAEIGDALKRRYPLSPSVRHGVARAILDRRTQVARDVDDAVLREVARDDGHLALLRALQLRSYVVVPLVARGTAIGAISFLACDRNFEDRETWLAEQLASSAATAIDNARLFDAEQKARTRIGKMQEVTAALSRARTAREVAEAACRIGSAAMAAKSGALWLARDDGALALAGSWGTPENFIREFRVIERDREGLPATMVMRTAEPVWVETEADYRSEAPAIFDRVKAAERLASYGAVPLMLDGRVAGVITFAHPIGHRYHEDERAFYVALAQHCSQALDRARLLDAERRSNARLRLLAAAGETLAKSLDFDDTLRSIARLTVPAFTDWCVVDVIEGTAVRRLVAQHESDERVRAAEAMAAAYPTRLGDGTPISRIIETGASVWRARITDDDLRASARDERELEYLRAIAPVSTIIVPLLAQDERIGAVSFTTAESGRVYDDDDLHFSEELGRRAGLAIANARLYRAAQDALATAEEANRVRDEFLATVSHELRTPLNAIGGWAALLAHQAGDAALVAKGLDVIRRNVQSQTKLVEDILDASRIITGKLRLDTRPVDLLAVVRDALEVVRPSADARKIKLEIVAEGPALVAGDAQRLQQVVWNLAANAVKFTGDGGRVSVHVGHEGASVALEVRDDGRGIEPEFLPFVFDRFRQADSSTSRRFGGLGLGLAIVRHIVELHGGRASAHSDGLGFGATFRVVLPAHVPGLERSGSDRPRTSSAPPLAASIAGLRILVVDDEPDARGLLEALLASEGAEVASASSASEAFDLLASFAPDVIVSDVGMPDEDGYAFIRRVRSHPSRVAATPAIALSAYTRAEDRLRALTSGFNTHVQKPVDSRELVAMIANLRAVGKA